MQVSPFRTTPKFGGALLNIIKEVPFNAPEGTTPGISALLFESEHPEIGRDEIQIVYQSGDAWSFSSYTLKSDKIGALSDQFTAGDVEAARQQFPVVLKEIFETEDYQPKNGRTYHTFRGESPLPKSFAVDVINPNLKSIERLAHQAIKTDAATVEPVTRTYRKWFREKTYQGQAIHLPRLEFANGAR